MNILLYQHTGSRNHGCEAILRTTAAMLGEEHSLSLHTLHRDEDQACQVTALFEQVYDAAAYRRWSPVAIARQIEKRLQLRLPGGISADRTILKPAEHADLALAVGGDVYCYFQGQDQWATDELLRKKHIRTVLWGCSLEPGDVQGRLGEHLKSFDLIVARESITYEALTRRGDLNRVVLCPDPAFTLPALTCSLPENFRWGNMVGLNLSPLVQKSEGVRGITQANYDALMQHILENTGYGIALIPHVTVPGSDDREAMQEIYEKYRDTGRVCMIGDMECRKLKYCIGGCRFFVAARTHASIAAYSQGIPTLVLGYSVKARGIARDLFGSEEHYVLPVQTLRDRHDLTRGFLWLEAHEDRIRQQLSGQMEQVRQRAGLAAEALDALACCTAAARKQQGGLK